MRLADEAGCPSRFCEAYGVDIIAQADRKRGAEKKGGFSGKNFFLPPFFCQLGLVGGTRAKS